MLPLWYTHTHNSQHLFYLFRRCFLCTQNTTVTSWYRKQETFCHSTSLQLLPGICKLITTEQMLPNTGENVWSVTTARCLVSSLFLVTGAIFTSGDNMELQCHTPWCKADTHGITVSHTLMQGWYIWNYSVIHPDARLIHVLQPGQPQSSSIIFKGGNGRRNHCLMSFWLSSCNDESLSHNS